jgi:hypothetical protein
VKRWKKQKAEQQRSKKRRPMPQPTGAASAGGTMSGMRKGLAGFFGGKPRDGGKPKGPAERLLDGVLWIAVVVAAIYFVQNRCMR